MTTQSIRNDVNTVVSAFVMDWKNMGRKDFRKAMLAYIINTYGVSLASAATHYNYALRVAQQQLAKEDVDGLFPTI